MTTYLLLCAGPGKRWQGHPPLTDQPKHFAPMNGEPLLHRLIRLIQERDDQANIGIVVSEPADERYVLPGTRLVIADAHPDVGGMEKIISARHAWNTTGRTVIVGGDVYWTTRAADLIVPYEGPEWRLFGRPGGNAKFTGKKWTEALGCAFWPHDHATVVAGVERRVVAHHAHGGPSWPHSWSPWWRAMQPTVKDSQLGKEWFWPPQDLGICRWPKWPTGERHLPHYTAIIDGSDDIDSPREWERWHERYEAASDDERARWWD